MQGEANLVFAASHPAFAGHFPGKPIVPGVLLLDAAIHAITQAGAPADSGMNMATCTVSSAKFLSPVSPDEALILRWSDTGKGQLRFDISGPGRQVAIGVLAFGGKP